MNILLSTDDNYVMPTGVLMTSIGENNGSDVCYYILTNTEFSDESRDALTRVADKYGNTISFHFITPEMTKTLPFGRDDQPGHVSIATYYRLFITEILPNDVHKILYLDGDMIVRHNLSELWNTDLSGYAVGVVHDLDEVKESKDERLPYPMKDTGYFNAGMLLINVDYWRQNRCFKEFMAFIDKNQSAIIYHDQDVLNTVFYDKKKWLPLTFNFQTRFICLPEYQPDCSAFQDQIDRYKYDPSIIHYVVSDKPWKISCFCPYRGAWRFYWRRSLWKDIKLSGDIANSPKAWLRNWALRNDLFYPKSIFERIIIRK